MKRWRDETLAREARKYPPRSARKYPRTQLPNYPTTQGAGFAAGAEPLSYGELTDRS